MSQAATNECSTGATHSESKAELLQTNGTLDVMGGIAEYCGALTLSTQTLDYVQVEASRRQDERITIRIANCYDSSSAGIRFLGNSISSNGESVRAVPASSGEVKGDWPLSVFYGARDGEFSATEIVVGYGRSGGSEALGLTLAVLRSMLVAGIVPHFGGGLSIQINSNLLGDRTRQCASLASCVFQAVANTHTVRKSASEVAAVLHSVFEEIGGVPCGLATLTSPMIDKAGFLSPICCRPLEIGECVALPAGVTLLGIDSGIVYPNATKKYLHARTTSMMGAAIIARLMGPSDSSQEQGHDYLSRISVSEYVERFRDLLPTKIKGQQFLDRFGPLPHRTTAVDAKEAYKIRSRTEHHIYENERVRHFADRLSRANRTGDAAEIVEAGELMYASHWSYGQRCGLGSRETDRLVNLLRDRGPDAGVYGARISGSGAGGTVVVLMRDSDEARSAIAAAVSQYERETGLVSIIQPAASAHS